MFRRFRVCALNAVLDHERMNFIERVVGLFWFILLLVVTPLVIWQTAHILDGVRKLPE
jgi:hypothetical protein